MKIDAERLVAGALPGGRVRLSEHVNGLGHTTDMAACHICREQAEYRRRGDEMVRERAFLRADHRR